MLQQKDLDSDDIIDDKNEAQNDENEMSFSEEKRKAQVKITKLENWKQNRRINWEKLRKVELPKTMIIRTEMSDKPFVKQRS